MCCWVRYCAGGGPTEAVLASASFLSQSFVTGSRGIQLYREFTDRVPMSIRDRKRATPRWLAGLWQCLDVVRDHRRSRM
ncbi:hypothetical protein PYCCODRAFT_1280481 [Trametes coccinea BRFM310]|uniref:Uncharacterized protein n=1 Tax=Trametes coccinea (strain BRFM310) TaxID=1353009 RepID=A0A1Y2IYK7_TRAC3|nr:hypothetical protein PYCCODRAFT_1280481 [Trametes coccinea BRFM310]